MHADDDSPPRNVALIGKGRGGRVGRVELIATCRRLALEEGDSLENMVWRVMRGLSYWGERGNDKSAALFLKYAAKLAPDDGAPVQPTVTVNNLVIGQGPPVPQDQSSYAKRCALMLRELELLG